MTKDNLFSPVTLGDVSIRNRIVMAPMTRNRATDTIPQPMMTTYYKQRASAGLIVTEATQVSPEGVGYPNTPGIYNDEQVDAWKDVTSAVHEEGGRIFMQLWHVGRISHPSLQPGSKRPVAPSPIKPEGNAMTQSGEKPFETPRGLQTEEIKGIVEKFTSAAWNAINAGFDGVEIHAANGYLIDQFLRTGSNERNDRYGGSVQNRARLLLEITDAVRDAVGSGRTSVRLSPGSTFNDMHDDNPAETFTFVASELGKRDLAYLHVIESVGDRIEIDFDAIKANYGGVYIANAGYDFDDPGVCINNDRADLVSFGKLFIANPDLPERLLNDAPLASADVSTFYGGGEQGYVDYPRFDRNKAA